jgi:copper ion binding protein
MSNETSIQIIEIPVRGMDCRGCVRDVDTALRAISGVANVKVSLEEAKAVVQIDPEKVTIATLHEAVEDAGFEVSA